MPTHASANEEIKQQYLNGHFCYAYKAVGDARLLLPLLKDFFRKHPLIDPVTFLGDAAFDSAEIYKALLSGETFGHKEDGSARIFERAFIPLNGRAS